jgi:hypothetical protein
MIKILKSYIKLLIEQKDLSNKISFLSNKYKMSEDVILSLSYYDPSPNKKYLDWICKCYSREDNLINDDTYNLSPLGEFLEIHYKIRHFPEQKFSGCLHKDINRYKNFDELLECKSINMIYIFLEEKSTEYADAFFRQMNQILQKFDEETIHLFIDLHKELESTNLIDEDMVKIKKFFDYYEKEYKEPGRMETWYEYIGDASFTIYHEYDSKEQEEIFSNNLKYLSRGTDYNLVYSSGDKMLLEVLTAKASCSLGFDSGWCVSTTQQDNSPTKSALNNFHNYTKDSKVFLLILRQGFRRFMIQIHDYGEEHQTMDISDNEHEFTLKEIGKDVIKTLDKYYENTYGIDFLELLMANINFSGGFPFKEAYNYLKLIKSVRR